MLLAADALPVLLLALGLDALLGDPDAIWRRVPHPVAWIGAMVAASDRRLNRSELAPGLRRALGAAALLAIVAVSAGAAGLIEAALRALPGGPAWLALAASVLIAQRSLAEHVGRVRTALARSLPEGRTAVAMIVGRDPDSLDRAGVARAAIESLAENLSDGVVAPAAWFAVAGLPGLAAYKAINTADSMIGHLSDRHRDFGWAAARTDDLANLVPARLTAGLLALAAPLAGGSVAGTWRVARRDAGLHRSPNAGWPESAAAAALGLALGGPRLYAAGPVAEPFLHPEGRRDAAPADIGRALRVMGGACLLLAAAIGLAAVALAGR